MATKSVGIAEEAGTMLEAVVPSIKLTADLVQEIKNASEEQVAVSYFRLQSNFSVTLTPTP